MGAVLLLLTIGANGVIAGLTDVSRYSGKPFIEASGIQRELGRFIPLLRFFELAPVTLEEAMREINPTRAEIGNYRALHGIGREEMSDEEIRREIALEKEEELRRYFDSLVNLRADFLRDRERFAYYLVETGTGRVYTNLDREAEAAGGGAEAAEEMMFLIRYPDRRDERLTAHGLSPGLPYKEEVAKAAARKPAKQFTGWIGVPKSENFLALYREYRKHQAYTFVMLGAGALLLALAAAAGARLSARTVGVPDGGAARGVRFLYGNVPIDLRFALILFTGMFAYGLHQKPILAFDRLVNNENAPLPAAEDFWRLAVLAVVTAAFAAQFWWSYRTLKEREASDEMRKSPIMRLVFLVRDAFLNLRIGAQVLLFAGVACGLGFAACAFAVDRSAGAAAILALLVPAAVLYVFFALKQAGYLNRLLAAARDYADGKRVGDLPAGGKSVMAELTAHWNRMRQDAEASRAKEAKSERLKAELITNVSHDLRTPLTSIISYVELLKRPELPEKERASYIDILDQKSKRLKVLIDDLFEASKMASGNVELSRERLDLVQLIQQALAESGAKAGDGGIEFRVKLPEEPVFAFVDGKKMWRVFDNLISNMLRYSLEGSRAYITLRREGGRAEIVFKNVTKYELGDNVDELLERFKRGDASRHTEGSGLGLAIAKSIVDLHGGTFELELDGDLFKAKVLLPAA